MSRRHREDGTGFRPVGLVAESVSAVDRATARAGYRVFRGAAGFEAAIPEQVVERMLALGHAAAPLEWLGLVVGRVGQDARGRHVVVLGVVPDPNALAELHFVQSTVASESETRSRARALYPDGVVVGWVHGHVRHGAQYSPTDRENQATWRQEHSLGIVVDPWDPRELAVYRGPQCELLAPATDREAGALRARVPAEGVGRSVAAEPTTHPAAAGVSPGAARKRMVGRAAKCIVLAALALVGTAWAARLDRSQRELTARMGKVERRLGRLEEDRSCRDRPWAPRPVAPPGTGGESVPPSFDAGLDDGGTADAVSLAFRRLDATNRTPSRAAPARR